METIRLAEIPIEILWEYAETKRSEVPGQPIAIGTIPTQETNETNGLPNDSSPLQLSVVGTKALLTTGSNRIKAAMQSGCKNVLVNISVFLGDGKKLFFDTMLTRFKPINQDLALCLKKAFL